MALMALGVLMVKMRDSRNLLKGYNIAETGLRPAYPESFDCSPLTSLYASWIDVDGREREEIHSGVDGGRLGDWVRAPGPGVIVAAWQANWGWGREGALLIKHTREGLNIQSGAPFYYSALYHLDFDEIKDFEEDEAVQRGQRLAKVFRPGGNDKYLPEVHWEVWEVESGARLEWGINRHGGKAWRNRSARLIDPLYMLSLEKPPSDDLRVAIPPFSKGRDYSAFRGFTYILPCVRKK